MSVRRAVAGLFLLALVAPTVAAAGGYYVPGIGTRSIGRGGAYVLSADDAGAMWSNPAALVRIQEWLYFHYDTTWITMQSEYTRTPYPGEDVDEVTGERLTDRGRVVNKEAPFSIPSVAYATNLGVDGFTLALGGYGPQGGDYLYDITGPQRYMMWKSDVTQAIYQLSAAYQPVEWFAFGAGLQLHQIDMRQYVVISLWPHDFWGFRGMLPREQVGWPEDPRFDAELAVLAEDYLAPSFNLGVLFETPSGIQLGGSFQYGISVEADGHIELTMPEYGQADGDLLKFQEIEMAGRRITLLFEVPWILRAAIRYVDPGGLFDFELALTYEAWSVHDTIVARPEDVAFHIPNTYKGFIEGCEPIEGLDKCRYEFGDIVVPKYWHDTISVRLGGEVRPLDWLRVRAGYYIDEGAVPIETIQSGLVDLDKHGLAVGATLTFGAVEIDLAYSHIFQPDVTIVGNKYRQIAPLNEEPDGYVPVAGYDGYATHAADGSYVTSYDVFGVGVKYRPYTAPELERLTMAVLFDPIASDLGFGVEVRRTALEFEVGFADLVALNLGVELADVLAFVLDEDSHVGVGGAAGLKFFLTDQGIGGLYLFPRASAVYLWGVGALVTPSAELGHAWTYADGLVVNLGASLMWNHYLDDEFSDDNGVGALLNFRIGYGW